MRKAYYFGIIFFVVLSGFFMPGTSTASWGTPDAGVDAAAEGWQITAFERENDQGSFNSLALDSDGNPHISFRDQTMNEVKYIYWQGDDWEEKTVDTLSSSTDFNTSLALDENGWPKIAYRFTNPDKTCQRKIAEWDGNQWQYDELEGSCTEYYINLALHGGDALCLSYYNWTYFDSRILFRCRVDSEWLNGSAVDRVHYSSVQELALYHSMVLQDDGTPHVSYYRQILSGPAQLWYATPVDNTWDPRVVDEGPGVGSYSSLALDDQNYPRISYYDIDNGDLKFAQWNGSQWELETVDDAGDVGKYTSLALDENDNPHISYYDATNNDLKYASWNGSDWDIESVDGSDDVGEWTSLKLDTDGNAHISYYDRTNGDLKYATNSGASDKNIYLPILLRSYP